MLLDISELMSPAARLECLIVQRSASLRMGAAFLLPQPHNHFRNYLPFVFQDGYEPSPEAESRGRSQVGLLFHTTMLAMMTTLLLPYPFMVRR